MSADAAALPMAADDTVPLIALRGIGKHYGGGRGGYGGDRGGY